MKRALSWKAVRRGDVYCSPACGGGCLFEKYQKACDAGEALAQKLGPDWAAHVWENMGWHYTARHASGLIEVDWFGKRSGYSAGIDGGVWRANGKTPRAAVIAVMNAALEGANKIASILGRLGRPIRIEEFQRLTAESGAAPREEKRGLQDQEQLPERGAK